MKGKEKKEKYNTFSSPFQCCYTAGVACIYTRKGLFGGCNRQWRYVWTRRRGIGHGCEQAAWWWERLRNARPDTADDSSNIRIQSDVYEWCVQAPTTSTVARGATQTISLAPAVGHRLSRGREAVAELYVLRTTVKGKNEKWKITWERSGAREDSYYCGERGDRSFL